MTKSKTKSKVSKQTTKNKRDEVSTLGKMIRAVGGIGGGALGSALGHGAAGAAMGSSLGAALSRWLGAGDYVVNSNSLVQRAASNIPMMHSNNQSILVRHREFISEISGSVNFTVQASYPINPGMASTFPWLSKIAANYQEYSIKGMVFHFVPTSGTAISTTNSALGSVIIQTTYRSNDSTPVSKLEMLNEFWSNEVVPYETMAHPIECDPKENPFQVHYIRSTDIPSGDVLLYDLGRTYVATAGMQGTNVVGDLWVTYEVELKKPMLYSNVSNNHYYGAVHNGGGGFASMFGAVIGTPVGDLRPTFSGNTISFTADQRDHYLIHVHLSGPFSGAVTWSTTGVFVNCVEWDIGGETANNTTCAASTTLSAIDFTVGIVYSNANASFSYTLPTPAVGSGSIGGTYVQIVGLM